MKNLFRVWVLTAFIFLFASASAYAAPVITSANINFTNNQMQVIGKRLVHGKAVPKVFFNGAPCWVIGTGNVTVDNLVQNEVTAQLPTYTGPIPPGTYEVKVQNGYGTSANFPVTYGAVGLQGPAGPASPSAMRAALLQWYPQTFQFVTNPQAIAFDGANIWVTTQLSKINRNLIFGL